MLKQGVRQLFRMTLLGSLWCLLVYSLLFGGFSSSLADYYGGGPDLTCAKVGCSSPAGCGINGTAQGCTLICAGGGSVQCPK